VTGAQDGVSEGGGRHLLCLLYLPAKLPLPWGCRGEAYAATYIDLRTMADRLGGRAL
jgi:hypothetical protein